MKKIRLKSSFPQIPIFIINLKERSDRLCHINKQFEGRKEFKIHIFNAIKNDIGAIGLFESLKSCVEIANKSGYEYIILCEDDHTFSDHYTFEKLFKAINIGKNNEFDILLGGVSGYENAIYYKDGLFWLENFTGMQFVVIFKRFYDKFSQINIKNNENIDVKMRQYTDRIFCIYPQISYQKNFPYSDVTSANQLKDVEEYFINSENRLSTLLDVMEFFKSTIRSLNNEKKH